MEPGSDGAAVREMGGSKWTPTGEGSHPVAGGAGSSNGNLRYRREQDDRTRVSPTGTLDASDPQIKQDVLTMIVQYLRSEKLFMAAVVIQDEANMKTAEQQARRAQGSRLRKATLEGDWNVVISLITKNLSRLHHKRFLYAVYRQEYLELIERQEYQKAFAFLNRRLKPMEATAASTPNEFLNLCYLLTCKSVSDADHFRSWGGVLGGREKLAEELARLVEAETGSLARPSQMPPNRLMTLLEQAVAFQIESGRYHPKVAPRASTLARDYRCPAVPDCARDVYTGGHTAGVKCVTFVGDEAVLLASGGADGDISLWPTNPNSSRKGGRDTDDDGDGYSSSDDNGGGAGCGGEAADARRQRRRRRRRPPRPQDHAGGQQDDDRRSSPGARAANDGAAEGNGDNSRQDGGRVSPVLTLRAGGGTAGRDKVRVWDVASNRQGSLLASASGDGAVRLWSLPPSDQLLSTGAAIAATAGRGGEGKGPSAVLSSEEPRGILRGHGDGLGSFAPDVYSVVFHSAEAHVVTAGHDRTVRLYDVESEQEVKVFAGHEAGVLHATSNPYGNLLVSGGRDSAIKFWDVMSGVCVKTLSQAVGAVTSVDMTMDGMYLLASSRHGPVRTWDVRMGRPLLRYKGHQNTSSSFLRASLGAEEGLVFGGSEDCKVYVWHRRETQLLHALSGHTGTVYRGTWSAEQGLLASCSEDGTVRTWWSNSL
eukprot:g5788.t2